MVLTGSLGNVGGRFTLNLNAVDPGGARNIGAASADVGNAKDLPARAVSLVAELMHWGATENAVRRFTLPPGRKMSFAVLDLTPYGVDASMATNLTQVLASEIKRVEGTTVISREDVTAVMQMQQTKMQVGCDDVACLVELGGALGVEMIAAGTVGKMGSAYVVSLRLISARVSRVDNVVTETFSGSEDQVILAVRRAARALLGINTAESRGTLVISVSEPGARIFMDGTPLGVSPLPPIPNLPPEQHAVQVSRDGFLEWQGDAYVEPGEATALWVKLEKRPLRWFERWWVWTIMGVAGTAGAATLLTSTALAISAAAGGVRYWQLTQQPPPQNSAGTVRVGGAP